MPIPVVHFADLCNEPVALLRHGFNILLADRLFTQGSTNDADIVVEVGLFNDAIRPYGRHKFVFGYQATMTFEKGIKGVKYPSPQWYSMPVTRQAPFAHFQPKWTEFEGL